MTDLARHSLTQDAKQAAALERRINGNGFAYASGAVQAILESEYCPDDERVERAILFLSEFEKERKTDKEVQ